MVVVVDGVESAETDGGDDQTGTTCCGGIGATSDPDIAALPLLDWDQLVENGVDGLAAPHLGISRSPIRLRYVA